MQSNTKVKFWSMVSLLVVSSLISSCGGGGGGNGTTSNTGGGGNGGGPQRHRDGGYHKRPPCGGRTAALPHPFDFTATKTNWANANMLDGRGTVAAVIDSGVNRTTDSHFVLGKDIFGRRLLAGEDYGNADHGTYDRSSIHHGTTVAAVLAGHCHDDHGNCYHGAAPRASIYPVSVRADSPGGKEYSPMGPLFDAFSGISSKFGSGQNVPGARKEKRLAAVNVSIGPIYGYTLQPLVGKSFVTVLAAGNGPEEARKGKFTQNVNTEAGTWGSHLPLTGNQRTVLVVGAVQREANGEWVPWNVGHGDQRTYSQQPILGVNSKYYVVAPGCFTSYTTPLVTALVCKLAQVHPYKTSQERVEIVCFTSTRLPVPSGAEFLGKSSEEIFGCGMINEQAALSPIAPMGIHISGGGTIPVDGTLIAQSYGMSILGDAIGEITVRDRFDRHFSESIENFVHTSCNSDFEKDLLAFSDTSNFNTESSRLTDNMTFIGRSYTGKLFDFANKFTKENRVNRSEFTFLFNNKSAVYFSNSMLPGSWNFSERNLLDEKLSSSIGSFIGNSYLVGSSFKIGKDFIVTSEFFKDRKENSLTPRNMQQNKSGALVKLDFAVNDSTTIKTMFGGLIESKGALGTIGSGAFGLDKGSSTNFYDISIESGLFNDWKVLAGATYTETKVNFKPGYLLAKISTIKGVGYRFALFSRPNTNSYYGAIFHCPLRINSGSATWLFPKYVDENGNDHFVEVTKKIKNTTPSKLEFVFGTKINKNSKLDLSLSTTVGGSSKARRQAIISFSTAI